jgi:hypothetical protein
VLFTYVFNLHAIPIIFTDKETKLQKAYCSRSYYYGLFLNVIKKMGIGWEKWIRPIIPGTWEVEIGKIKIHRQPGQEVRDTPISTKDLGMVVQTCHTSYVGGVSRRIMLLQATWAKNLRRYLKK